MYEFAMLFPGQGSQYIGMLSSFLYKNDNVIRQTFNEASHYIKYDLLKLITEGPKEKLNQNQYTQVAILTSSVAIYRLWNSKNGRSPLLMSGHSLGEYSALVCSNAIKFSDALKIVFLRGKLMENTSINRPALMHAIIGIDKKIVQTACAIYSKKQVVTLASINSHNHMIISGDKNAVYKTSLKCKKFGAKYIFNLNINIAAHSELMKPISEKLNKILNVTVIRTPTIPIINNVDVKFEKTSKKIKNALIRQIYSTVRWQEIINLITLQKIFIMLEVGPNKILTNLNKKNKNIIAFDTNNLNNFLIAFKKINRDNYEQKQNNSIYYRG